MQYILLDSEKCERSAPSIKSIFDFIYLFSSCLQNTGMRAVGIARLDYLIRIRGVQCLIYELPDLDVS